MPSTPVWRKAQLYEYFLLRSEAARYVRAGESSAKPPDKGTVFWPRREGFGAKLKPSSGMVEKIISSTTKVRRDQKKRGSHKMLASRVFCGLCQAVGPRLIQDDRLSCRPLSLHLYTTKCSTSAVGSNGK